MITGGGGGMVILFKALGFSSCIPGVKFNFSNFFVKDFRYNNSLQFKRTFFTSKYGKLFIIRNRLTRSGCCTRERHATKRNESSVFFHTLTPRSW